MSVTINAKLTGHVLTLVEAPQLAAGSVAVDRVHFEFDEAWAGLNRVALFWDAADGEPYAALVGADDCADVPWEALQARARIRFGVYGIESGQTVPRITSTVVKYAVAEGAWSDSIANSGEPTATLIEQFQAAAAQAIDQVQAAADAIQEPLDAMAGDISALEAGKVEIADMVSRYAGRKMSILGDSISTFNAEGYKIDGYNMWYPTGDVTSVEDTWFKQVLDASGTAIEVNASWSGSRVTNTHSNASYPDFYQRCGLLGDPDVIFVALGTNDSTYSIALGNYDFETAYASLSEAAFRTAYIKGVKALKANYPSAEIVLLIMSMGDAYADSIRHIGAVLGAQVVDCRGYQGSGVHPGAAGMRWIASRVLYPVDGGLTVAGMAADASAVGTALAGKVAVDQGAANAGKALVVGADGCVTVGDAGIPEAVKVSLLNLFRHVAYTDGQGQDYYDALYAALYASSESYPRISAAFDPGTHTVFADDALDTLKPYLAVTYFETEQSAGVQLAASDYTLGGALAEGPCSVSVSYDGLVTAVQVNAVDLYGTHRWSTAENLTVISSAPGIYNGTCGYPNTDNKRRSVWARYGKKGAYDNSAGRYSDSLYPIPVPDDASVASIVIENASSLPNLMPAVSWWVYDDATGVYSKQGETGWVSQGTDAQLPSGTKRFIAVNMKANSAGSATFSVEPVVTVVFS